MRIRYENFIWLIIEIVQAVLLLFLKSFFESYEKPFQLRLLFATSTIVLFLSLLMIKNNRKSFDCYSILLSLLYVFMFGQHALFSLNIYPTDMIILSNRVSKEALFETGFFVLLCVTILNVGYLFSLHLFGKNKQYVSHLESSLNSEIEKESLYKASIIVLILVLIPTIVTLATNIHLTFTVGYAERMLNSSYRKSGITNITSILSSFMIPALLALFISRDKTQKWPLAIIVAYMILYTLSGSRISTMILLLGILYIQNKQFAKLNWRRLLEYTALSVIVISLFSIVSVARTQMGEGRDLLTVLDNSLDVVIEKNPLVAAIAEAGYTFAATATVIDNCPSIVDYNNGLSYLSGLIYILPNGLTNSFFVSVQSTDEVFKGFINSYGSGIGSSFIAEAYWNFGYFGLLLMFLFGLLLGKMSLDFDTAIYRRKYIRIFIFAYIFVCIAFYVRSDTRTFLRNFTWFCLPVAMLSSALNRKIRYR